MSETSFSTTEVIEPAIIPNPDKYTTPQADTFKGKLLNDPSMRHLASWVDVDASNPYAGPIRIETATLAVRSMWNNPLFARVNNSLQVDDRFPESVKGIIGQVDQDLSAEFEARYAVHYPRNMNPFSRDGSLSPEPANSYTKLSRQDILDIFHELHKGRLLNIPDYRMHRSLMGQLRPNSPKRSDQLTEVEKAKFEEAAKLLGRLYDHNRFML